MRCHTYRNLGAISHTFMRGQKKRYGNQIRIQLPDKVSHAKLLAARTSTTTDRCYIKIGAKMVTLRSAAESKAYAESSDTRKPGNPRPREPDSSASSSAWAPPPGFSHGSKKPRGSRR